MSAKCETFPQQKYVGNTIRFSRPWTQKLGIPKVLHDPQITVDKTDFGLVIYNHANFYRFEETSSYWSVKRISVFLCFSLVNQRHTSCITVYNRTVTNVESNVRAVHSWFDLNLIFR